MPPTSTADRRGLSTREKKAGGVTVSTRQLPVTGRATFVTRPVFCGIFAIPSYFGIAQLCAPAAGM
jgi:hypothetical protein